MMQAAANGHIDTVRLLIEANASLLKIAANGDTALQLAQKRKDPSLIQLVAFHTYLQRAEKN
ncbi:MAG: ankyrin repeat domain-containing protein [Coxiellaceae bacterium]|nr:MAG: ankyrin repeat domain-containing protein [Coxiellaceae bacterium]